MDQDPLVNAHVEAGIRFVREFERSTPLGIAFWLRKSELKPWVLCLASQHLVNGDVSAAYDEVLKIAQRMNDPYVDPYRIRLVPLTDPLVQSAIRLTRGHSHKIPLYLRGPDAGATFEEMYIIKSEPGVHKMPSGREALHQIIDREAQFFEQHGRPPQKLKLPVLMAYDLAKCGRDELGDLSGRVFKDGVSVFEREGFHGMTVEIVRDRNAQLELE